MADPVKPTTVIKTPEPTVASKTPKTSPVKPVKAVHRINGSIEPGTIFVPESAELRTELFDLDAVVELSDDEAKLFKSDDAVDLG